MNTRSLADPIVIEQTCFDENLGAKRVVIVGEGYSQQKQEVITRDVIIKELQTVEIPTIVKEYEKIEVPVIIKEVVEKEVIVTKEVQGPVQVIYVDKPVITKEIETVFVDRIVIEERIKTIEVQVIVKEPFEVIKEVPGLKEIEIQTIEKPVFIYKTEYKDLPKWLIVFLIASATITLIISLLKFFK